MRACVVCVAALRVRAMRTPCLFVWVHKLDQLMGLRPGPSKCWWIGSQLSRGPKTTQRGEGALRDVLFIGRMFAPDSVRTSALHAFAL